MKLTRSKKMFLIIALTAFVVLLFSSNTAFAAINESYLGNNTVPDTNLDEAFSDSTILQLLARLIYAVGRFLEWILGTIFKLLTGSSDFPWADKIVFNAVPLLDVNFINPGAESFVIQPGIQGVLKNLYATILTLAASFFGIVVLITAIKLVISTIASDKAKYKQAIVDWLVGFVMLFCIHYAISFIFYLNEQLVVVASKMVTTQLNDSNSKAHVKADALASDLIEDVRKKGITYNGTSVADILEQNTNILTIWMNALASNDTSKGLQEGLMKSAHWYTLGLDVANNTEDQYRNLGMIISWAASENISVSDLASIKKKIKVYREGPNYMDNGRLYYNANQAIETTELKKLFVNKNTGAFDSTMYNYFVQALDGIEETFKGQQDENNMQVKPVWTGGFISSMVKGSETLIEKDYYLLSEGVRNISNEDYYYEGSVVDFTNFYWTEVIDDMITLKGASDTSSGKKVSGSGGTTRLISDLAAYFRYNSYSKELRTTNVTGVKNGGNIEIQNMIMYAILVAQSLILFIAYVKRLFYVILLAMMAPVVVVFDFFQKFGK